LIINTKRRKTKDMASAIKLDENKIKKIAIPALAGVFVISALLLLFTVFSPPKAGKPIQETKAEANEGINTMQLQVDAHEKRLKTCEENIKKIYNNQVELNKTLANINKDLDAIKNGTKDNKAYIAMMYQKVLDLELQVNSLGGGFNMKPKNKEEAINPLIGTDSLPAENK
jgi:septal ring factor EnvC (AmiA/AmiB activator)